MQGWDNKYYASTGYPLRCPNCGSKQIKSVAKSIDGGYTSEEEHVCRKCNIVVAYWAYGAFDPNYNHEGS